MVIVLHVEVPGDIKIITETIVPAIMRIPGIKSADINGLIGGRKFIVKMMDVVRLNETKVATNG
jgi:hypothetical protein